MKSLMAIDGMAQVVELEVPELLPQHVRVKTHFTAVSPGTERLLIGSSASGDRRLGYSAVGEIIELGEGVNNYSVGDIVACYGAPYVSHSSELVVPKTLISKVPSHVPTIHASFAAHGAIAIHAIRKAHLQFGETVIIVGLGVLGQMIAKICSAAAYEVIAYEPIEARANMINGEGSIHAFSSLSKMAHFLDQMTEGHGADAVLLCTGGKHSETTAQSLDWVRKQGKIVIVGDVEPVFPREKMFGKEAAILISRAGGPGRYDPLYEKMAVDYPYGYVRWTEGRNVKEFIRLLAQNRIDITPFIKSIVDIKDAATIYDDLLKQPEELTKIIRF
ncbi:zinc-dependent alcohol dehydrogenase [Solibacillus sp. FSL H8-0538]|uniref:zinc-dependent alcohol dehydrogenase n=1 Tax=Solibacillus sp. FSL H8-0538 TaxID=2921400 RepID=UPI0030F889A3